MEKTLYEKTCERCKLIFRTDKKMAYICPTCKKKNAKELQENERRKLKSLYKKHTPKKPIVSIAEQVKIIEKYNLEHKTYYTYGQFMELLNSGKISIEE